MNATPHHDAVAYLTRDLSQMLQGDVSADGGARGLYSTDASNYRLPPLAVVEPRSVDEAETAVAACRRYALPLLLRGGGTSLAGQGANRAVLLDTSRYMNRIVTLDPVACTARVEPGVVLDTLRTAAEEYGLTFGPDPATHDHCTLGGMIGNNSCGVHSVMAGRTVDNVERLEILTYDGLRTEVGPTSEDELRHIIGAGGRRGEIYRALAELRDRHAQEIRRRYPRIPRRVSGYNLNQLLPENGFHVARALVGSEGTLVTVLSATLRLVNSPPHRVLVVLGFPDVYVAGDHVPDVLAHGPIALEGLDDRLIADQKRKRMNRRGIEILPEGRGWLIAEFGAATREEAERQAQGAAQALSKIASLRIIAEPDEQTEVWEVRESGLGATARVQGKPDTWPGWEDSAVAPDRIGAYMRDLRKLLDSYGLEGDFYGHFGDGCLHTRISFDLATAKGRQRYRDFLGDAADLIIRYGGSFSGEHGDGQARSVLLPKIFGEELMAAFRRFKAIWDPDEKMNPGRIVDPYKPLTDLRIARFEPAPVETFFRYPEDAGDFARATTRCVGVGKCRREGGGTMCPSYMVTKEEQHSTRGRARLLFEMLQGEVVRRGWRDPAVKEALDLCLACKGCKHDCPVQVDMATYKAEFMAHYFKGRMRPRHAYAMGLIPWWAQAASHIPRLANFVTHAPLLAPAAKLAAGIARERDMPRFATQTFRRWFERQPLPRDTGRTVVLWNDTFTDYFNPEIGQAAVRLLTDAGYTVRLSPTGLCCGRPLYDFGMLTMARRWLERILDTLTPELDARTPIVGLEPSCLAVLRDELVELFPDDARAQALARQSYMLGELLGGDDRYAPPSLAGRALMHGHCHQKSVLSLEDDAKLCARAGLDCHVLDSGCCGMAGAFGFEAGKYAVSVQCGERVLLPAVRAADPETIVIANGFSCREQIRQLTGRRALHLAEALLPKSSRGSCCSSR